MTTAARPTWAPAKGGHEQGGVRMFGPSQKFSSRDLASHTTLKIRKDGQDTTEDLRKRDLRDELEDRERHHFSSKERNYSDDRDRRKTSSASGGYLEGSKRDAEDRLPAKNLDADDSDAEAKSDSDESDEEDDTAELLAELERIKKERAEEKLRKERQQQDQEMKVKEAELVRGNPLLNPTSFTVKRRWDDDVVFKNQARGELKTAKRFINDTIRNDFHRKFLNKYMK
jgi:protein CWC15